MRKVLVGYNHSEEVFKNYLYTDRHNLIRTGGELQSITPYAFMGLRITLLRGDIPP